MAKGSVGGAHWTQQNLLAKVVNSTAIGHLWGGHSSQAAPPPHSSGKARPSLPGAAGTRGSPALRARQQQQPQPLPRSLRCPHRCLPPAPPRSGERCGTDADVAEGAGHPDSAADGGLPACASEPGRRPSLSPLVLPTPSLGCARLRPAALLPRGPWGRSRSGTLRQGGRSLRWFTLCGASTASADSLSPGHGDDTDDFNLEDALFDPVTRRPTPKGPRRPAGGTDFDLADYFDTPVETTTKAAKPTPKPFPRPGKPDSGFWDVIRTTTTKQPKTTRAPPKRNPEKDPMDFDLADALDDKNDRKDPGRPDVRPGEGFSDDDLASIVDGGYSPDKKKGASGNTDNDYSGVAETGTIAGIASGLAMALIGAVSSYISYQQKKFCFSIQQGLNAEYVKGENMEAVVSEEPQVKYSVLETQSAEPPKQDSAKI
ncbi:CD99 antigen-like protein 2 [Onychostruthus taczanowskii]|uniref:CD99 antigen-like protein 2 n=1 Tax=Onychostruthus taczanowskii TaxID=356909 RepID=UPI001B801B7F|nr:CD99 antigen-like protein 2 [Onychostruthus taczanowskii]